MESYLLLAVETKKNMDEVLAAALEGVETFTDYKEMPK